MVFRHLQPASDSRVWGSQPGVWSRLGLCEERCPQKPLFAAVFRRACGRAGGTAGCLPPKLQVASSPFISWKPCSYPACGERCIGVLWKDRKTFSSLDTLQLQLSESSRGEIRCPSPGSGVCSSADSRNNQTAVHKGSFFLCCAAGPSHATRASPAARDVPAGLQPCWCSSGVLSDEGFGERKNAAVPLHMHVASAGGRWGCRRRTVWSGVGRLENAPW